MEIEDKRIENLLFGYFAGDLSDDEQQELLRWLEAGDSHKKRLSEVSDRWALFPITQRKATRIRI